MTFLVTDFIAQQGTGAQGKTGTDGRLREATAGFLVAALRSHLLIPCCIRHADAGTVNDNNSPAVEWISVWFCWFLKRLYCVQEDRL